MAAAWITYLLGRRPALVTTASPRRMGPLAWPSSWPGMEASTRHLAASSRAQFRVGSLSSWNRSRHPAVPGRGIPGSHYGSLLFVLRSSSGCNDPGAFSTTLFSSQRGLALSCSCPGFPGYFFSDAGNMASQGQRYTNSSHSSRNCPDCFPSCSAPGSHPHFSSA